MIQRVPRYSGGWWRAAREFWHRGRQRERPQLRASLRIRAGLEPATLRLRSRRSIQLSYRAMCMAASELCAARRALATEQTSGLRLGRAKLDIQCSYAAIARQLRAAASFAFIALGMNLK